MLFEMYLLNREDGCLSILIHLHSFLDLSLLVFLQVMNEKDDVADDQNSCRDNQQIISGFFGYMPSDHAIAENYLNRKNLEQRQHAYNTGSDIYAEFNVREQEYQNED